MDPILLGLAGVGAAGFGLWVAARLKAARLRSWEELARRLGLNLVTEPKYRDPWLWGVRRGVPVKVRTPGVDWTKVTAFFSVDLPEGVVIRPMGQGWPRVPPGTSWRSLGNGLELGASEASRARADDFAHHSVVWAVAERLKALEAPFALSSRAIVVRLFGPHPKAEQFAQRVDDLVTELERVEAALGFQVPDLGRRSGPEDEETLGETTASEAPQPSTEEAVASQEAAGKRVGKRAGKRDGKLEALVAGLQEEGTLDSEGEFTLDRDVAREKLRRFQLEDPLAFVLLVLKAALVRGASRVRLETKGSLRMTFDGPNVTRSDVDRIWSCLLSARGAAEDRWLRHLGLGLHAALGAFATEVRVRSGSGPGGIDWRIHAKARSHDNVAAGGVEAEECKRWEEGKGETEIVFTKPRWPEGGRAALRGLLDQRLGYQEAEVSLDGERLAAGGQRLPSAKGVVELPGEMGALGFVPSESARGRIFVVEDGVLVEAVAEPALLPDVQAVVTHPELATDLSLRRVVRDRVWQEVRDAVLGHQQEALKAFLAEAFPADRQGDGEGGGDGDGDGEREGEGERPDPWAAAVARACLGSDWASEVESEWVDRGSVPPEELRQALTLAALPLFPTADGGLVSLADIEVWRREQDELDFTSISLDRACPVLDEFQRAVGDPARILVLAWPMRPVEGRSLARAYGGRLRDVTAAIRRLPRDEVLLKERLDRPLVPPEGRTRE